MDITEAEDIKKRWQEYTEVCCQICHHSVMSDSVTPWTVACEVPPSMGFSKQEYWSGLPLHHLLGKDKFILFATNLQRDFMLLVAQKVKNSSRM